MSWEALTHAQMARHVAGHWMKADAGVLDLVGMLWADFANEPVGKDAANQRGHAW